MLTEKSAGAVTVREKEGVFYYLLLHYRAGHWDFPKGNTEEGEEIKETVRREINEETGIKDIEFITGFKERIKYSYRLEGKLVFKTVVFFLARTKTEKITLSFEHIGFEWLVYPEALEKLTFKIGKELLEKANRFLMEGKK